MFSRSNTGSSNQGFGAILQVLCTVLLVATLCFQTPAKAEEEVKPLHAAVVDTTRIQAQALVWKDLRVKFKEQNDLMVEDLKKAQSALEEEGRSLSEQQSILAPEAFAKKREEFEAKLRDQNQKMGQRKQILESALNEAQRKIAEHMQNIVVQIADEMGLNLVLDASRNKSAIVFARQDIDITEEIIKRLDAQLQTVNFTPITAK